MNELTQIELTYVEGGFDPSHPDSWPQNPVVFGAELSTLDAQTAAALWTEWTRVYGQYQQ